MGSVGEISNQRSFQLFIKMNKDSGFTGKESNSMRRGWPCKMIPLCGR